MMWVVDKRTNDIVQVYDVAYDKKGFAHFLVYKDGAWVRDSAKHYVPIAFWSGGEKE